MLFYKLGNSEQLKRKLKMVLFMNILKNQHKIGAIYFSLLSEIFVYFFYKFLTERTYIYILTHLS